MEKREVELYIALELPNGSVYFYPDWGETPHSLPIELPAELDSWGVFLSIEGCEAMPGGVYTFYAAIFDNGSLEPIGPVSRDRFTFNNSAMREGSMDHLAQFITEVDYHEK